MSHPVLVSLRILIVWLEFMCVLLQVWIVSTSLSYGRMYWEVSDVAVPYAVIGVAGVVCAQVALGALWRLLTMVFQQRIFAPDALRWVDLITWCAIVATVLATGAFAFHSFVKLVGGASTFIAMLISASSGAAFVLLMVVLRGLLVSATSDRREVEGLI